MKRFQSPLRLVAFSAALVSASFASASFALLPASVIARAEEPRFPNSEDLRHIKAISSPALSPDGKQVQFTLTESTADGAATHIWLVPVGGGAARQLTYSPSSDKRGEHNAVWSPDGSAIYFIAKRGENTQIFRLPLAGGEASPYDLKIAPPVDDSKEKNFIPPAMADAKSDSKSESKSDSKSDVKPEQLPINPIGFAISPDSHWLAVWAQDPETPGEKKGKDAKADAVWVNHENHGARLYLAALKPDSSIDGALKSVGVSPDVHGVSWSPKSDRFLVVTEAPNDVSDLGPATKTWLVRTDAIDKPEALNMIPATIRGTFAWNESATQIAFAAQTPIDAPPGVEELFALSIPDGKIDEAAKPIRLTPDLKDGLGFNETVFLKNGKILTGINRGTRQESATLTPGGNSAPEFIPQTTPLVTGLSSNEKQSGWIWLAEGSDHPPSLCYAENLGAACQTLPIPDLTKEHFRSVKSKLIQWQSLGMTIEGLLYLPPDAEKKKVPLIIDVHGGPTGAWEDRYEEWTGFLVGHGWAVLRPNPRGSSGYGAAFAAANKNDLGGKDYEDVMAGLDFALKNYPIDDKKLALMGYSYGGEMAGFVEGKTDRFKAIISGAPVIDQFSEYGTEGGSWYDSWFYGKPWEHFEDAWRQSPLSGVGKAKTPFLLLQGQSDTTDPVGQAEEMYRALRQAGVPVDLVTYPRENHGPLARGIFGFPVSEPWHGYDGRQRIVEFLQKYLGEESK